MAPLERLEHNTIALWTGILGTTLFFGLFAGALIRLAVHMRRNVTSPPVFRRCHVVIVLYSALDIPRFAVTLFKGVAVEYQSGLLPRIVYSMHLLSMWLQVVALTMIILMWAAVFTGATPLPPTHTTHTSIASTLHCCFVAHSCACGRLTVFSMLAWFQVAARVPRLLPFGRGASPVSSLR